MNASSTPRRPVDRVEAGLHAAPQLVNLDRIDLDGLALRARTLRSRVVWRAIRRTAGALLTFARPTAIHHPERRPA